MNTWTSKFAFLVGAALSLTGCADLGSLSDGLSGNRGDAVTRFDILEGHVRVATPDGYCIDPRSSRPGFVLAARCDRLGVPGKFAAHDIAIVTVTAAPASGADKPDPTVLARLSGEGVDVLEADERGGLALVRLDAAGTEPSDRPPYHWRGVFEIRQHLVGLTLYAPQDSNLAGAEGARLLADFSEAIKRASHSMPKQATPVRSLRPVARSGTIVAKQSTLVREQDDAA